LSATERISGISAASLIKHSRISNFQVLLIEWKVQQNLPRTLYWLEPVIVAGTTTVLGNSDINHSWYEKIGLIRGMDELGFAIPHFIFGGVRTSRRVHLAAYSNFPLSSLMAPSSRPAKDKINQERPHFVFIRNPDAITQLKDAQYPPCCRAVCRGSHLSIVFAD